MFINDEEAVSNIALRRLLCISFTHGNFICSTNFVLECMRYNFYAVSEDYNRNKPNSINNESIS